VRTSLVVRCRVADMLWLAMSTFWTACSLTSSAGTPMAPLGSATRKVPILLRCLSLSSVCVCLLMSCVDIRALADTVITGKRAAIRVHQQGATIVADGDTGLSSLCLYLLPCHSANIACSRLARRRQHGARSGL
jgi:hypothetical protein